MIGSLLMGAALMTMVSLDMKAEPWRSVNDGVMGGLSVGGMRQTADGLRFSGVLSLENNGGFCSVRRHVEHDLSAAGRVRLEVRGDGRQYQFRVRQDEGFDGIAWRALFATSPEWREVEISLDEFVPVFRGRIVSGAGALDPSKIRQVGLLLADKTPGEFSLDIRNIEFLGPESEPPP